MSTLYPWFRRTTISINSPSDNIQLLALDDSVLEKHVCQSDCYFTTLNCFRKRVHAYCYGHIKNVQDCQQCQHSCDSKLMKFVLNEFNDCTLNETIRFARLAQFGKDRWLPIKSGLQKRYFYFNSLLNSFFSFSFIFFFNLEQFLSIFLLRIFLHS